jgi:uncharacterized membrane protein
VARLIGIRDDEESRAVMRKIGLREITSGVGILAQPRPTAWLWSRLAGDLMDLALLNRARGAHDADRSRVTTATAAVVGVTVVDLYCSEQLRRSADGAAAGRPAQVSKSLTINRPAEELYRYWRDFENLPRFMSAIETVEARGERQSYWRAKGPAGVTVEWTSEITEDRPNELIAWLSLPGSDLQTSGQVRFQPAPGGRGTEVRVELNLSPPGGMIGAKIAHLFSGGFEQLTLEDLRRFKQLMETGELVRSDARIGGERPAQPPPDELWRQVAASGSGTASLSR